MVCGYVYYGEEIPDDYKCPICKVPKEMFKKK
jgi:rubrerythrin